MKTIKGTRKRQERRTKYMSRKDLRRKERKVKKQMKFEYQKKRKLSLNVDLKIDVKTKHEQPKLSKQKKNRKKDSAVKKKNTKEESTVNDEFIKLTEEMQEERKNQLKLANEEEDKNIKKLAKALKLNKRKNKSLPKSFTDDGLDYILEVCEPNNMKMMSSANAEIFDSGSGSEFEEDFAVATGKQITSKEKRKAVTHKDSETQSDSDVDINEVDTDPERGSDDELESDGDDGVSGSGDSEASEKVDLPKKRKSDSSEKLDLPKKRKSDSSEKLDLPKKRKSDSVAQDAKKKTRLSVNSKPDVSEMPDESSENSDFREESDSEGGGDELSDDQGSADAESGSKNKDGYWEDIYGRLRDKKGNVVQKSSQAYIPPQQRAQLMSSADERKNAVIRLRKQMKGLLNRLAESNMHNIAGQIEDLYMSHSRNDMNDSLTELMLESLMSPVKTPERLLMEHALLVAVLHANVGTEVGAYVLQMMVKKFDEIYNLGPTESKELDNLVLFLSHMYNFKMFHSILMFNLLEKFCEGFTEKDIELILLVLKTVGFTLRKSDPLVLKDVIIKLQRKASAATEFKDNSRVKFMLDVMLAIRNNNMQTIPNYDTSHMEHLKKLMRGFIRKGSFVTELNISLEDLLKAEERGRWWIVGSAWSGTLPGEANSQETGEQTHPPKFSDKLLEIAKKQRMNTDIRRNIFCILMSAEDYLDAFENLLRLGLKNQQDREIVHVIMHCCIQEGSFNPYYALLAQKFCDYDRKYQMIIQYTLWDKLKEIDNLSRVQRVNLAKFLTHLFVEMGLPLSVLKVIQFAEMNKTLVKFLRKILLGILLHPSEETCQQVFLRVAVSPKLHMFREGMRLFLHHFVLRKKERMSEQDSKLLDQRVNVAEKAIMAGESKMRL